MDAINVFLASSNELFKERVRFGDFIRQKDDEFEETKGIRVKLLKWEDFSSFYSRERKQEEYNSTIRTSKVFVALFRTKLGCYTKEECEVALQNKRIKVFYCFLPSKCVRPELLEFEQNSPSSVTVFNSLNEVFKEVEAYIKTLTDTLDKKNNVSENVIELGLNCNFTTGCLDAGDIIRHLSDVYEMDNVRIKLKEKFELEKIQLHLTIVNSNKNVQNIFEKLDQAVEHYSTHENPDLRLAIFVKNSKSQSGMHSNLFSDIEQKYEHYANKYTNYESLCLQLVFQLMDLIKVFGKATILNGNLFINNTKVVDMNQVSFVSQNNDFAKKRKQLNQNKNELKAQGKTDELLVRRAKLCNELDQLNIELFNFAHNLYESEKDHQGDDAFSEVRQAFYNGDIQQAKDKLRELTKYFSRYIEESLEIDKKLLMCINACKLEAKLELLDTSSSGRFEKAFSCYDKIIQELEQANKTNFLADIYYDYACLLDSQNEEKCINYFDKALRRYTSDTYINDKFYSNIILCHTKKGIFYWTKEMYSEAEEEFKAGFDIEKNFKSIDPEYVSACALLNNDYTLQLVEQVEHELNKPNWQSERLLSNLDKALEYYNKSLLLYNPSENPSECSDCIAAVYSNIGRLYWHKYRISKLSEHFNQSMKYLTDARKIRIKESLKNPIEMEPKLVFVLNNLAELYQTKGEYKWAILFYLRSKKLLERNKEYAPSSIIPRLAGVMARLAVSFAKIGKEVEAKNEMKHAIEMVKKCKEREQNENIKKSERVCEKRYHEILRKQKELDLILSENKRDAK